MHIFSNPLRSKALSLEHIVNPAKVKGPVTGIYSQTHRDQEYCHWNIFSNPPWSRALSLQYIVKPTEVMGTVTAIFCQTHCGQGHCHWNKLPNPEPLNHHETPGRQIKQSNQLSLTHQDD